MSGASRYAHSSWWAGRALAACFASALLFHAPGNAQTTRAYLSDVEWPATSGGRTIGSTGAVVERREEPLESLVPSQILQSEDTDPRPELPVLLPAAKSSAAGRSLGPAQVKVYPRTYSYAATQDLGRAVLLIAGTRVVFDLSPADPIARTMDTPADRSTAEKGIPFFALEQTEGGWAVRFNRFGVAYSVEINCDDDHEDRRCADGEFIRSVALSLALANQKRATSGERSLRPAPALPPAPRPIQNLPVVQSRGNLFTGPKDSRGVPFTFFGAGDLQREPERGVPVNTNFAPGMRFPVEKGPAFANSIIFGRGGGGYNKKGAQPGHECDKQNYAYPWRDNFCEERHHKTPACTAGIGHQGQDIRGADCVDDKHWVVAVEDGVILTKGYAEVSLRGRRSELIYYFRHMKTSSVPVAAGETVTRGQRIGRISNVMKGGTYQHLHFEILGAASVGGKPGRMQKLPAYPALVDAYIRLLNGER